MPKIEEDFLVRGVYFQTIFQLCKESYAFLQKFSWLIIILIQI